MKTVIVFLAMNILAPALSACDKGCTEYQGVCACDIAPEKGPAVAQPAQWTSDEKPPRSGMPSWQSPDIHVVDMPTMAQDDADQEKAKSKADFVGKKAAGLIK